MAKVNRRVTKKAKPKTYPVMAKLWRACQWLFVTSLTLSVLGIVGFYGVKTTQSFLNRPIAAIVVEGRFEYVTKEQVTMLVEKMIGDSFVSENIDQIKNQLQDTPWIDEVTLVRQWPDRLVVKVKEQSPIARWGDEGFVNVRGELVFTKDNDSVLHLSTLYGDKKEAATIMQQYSVLATVLQPYGLNITALEKDSRGVWQLSSSNGWEVILGRGELLKKIQRLTHLLDKELLTTKSSVSSIDMRYSNGVSVQWSKTQERQQEQVTNLRHQKNMSNKEV